MTIVCQTNLNHGELLVLPKHIDDDIHAYETELVTSYGYTNDKNSSKYHITVGHCYMVFGILICDSLVCYLIQDDDNYPTYCPASMFSIQDPNAHWSWAVSRYVVGNQKLMLFGYPAQLESYEELTALINQDRTALGKFLEHKEFILQYS